MADRAVRAARTYLFFIATEADHGFIVSGAVEKSASLLPSGHVGRKKFSSKKRHLHTPNI
jgi:hypothetical protein